LRLVSVDDAQALRSAYAANREHLAPWEPRRPDGFFTADAQARRIAEAVGPAAVGLTAAGPTVVETTAVRLTVVEPTLRYARLSRQARCRSANRPVPAISSAGSPSSTIRPCSITSTRSAISTVDSRCAITTAVRPRSTVDMAR
jgi:hypothetical protein